MKFKLKEKNNINLLLTGALFISIIFTLTSSFYMQKLSGNNLIENDQLVSHNTGEKNKKINEFVKSVQEKLVDEVDIDGKVSAILLNDGDRYKSVLFDYESGEQIEFKDLIKDEKQEDFKEKINYLLHLKYPAFIADNLSNNSGENVYYLKKNELIIYYYNYQFDPIVCEEISLRVNYNEIKDYMKFNGLLDSEYTNEDGKLVDEKKKIIAITFDDGPGSYTSNLLDILEKNRVTATFFMLGKNINYYQDVVKRAHDLGMEIAYHSYAHTNFKRQPIDEIKSELEVSNQILKNITGDTFHLIRPPYGSINEEIKSSLDNPFILWSVDTEDWRYKDVEYLKKYVLDNAKDGDIILFHDIHKTSVEAIDVLLPILYANGFQVTTVSNLANTFNNSLENHGVYRYFKR